MSAELATKCDAVLSETDSAKPWEPSQADPSVYERFKAMMIVVALYMGAIGAIGMLVRWWTQ